MSKQTSDKLVVAGVKKAAVQGGGTHTTHSFPARQWDIQNTVELEQRCKEQLGEKKRLGDKAKQTEQASLSLTFSTFQPQREVASALETAAATSASHGGANIKG